jgi:hypothetical protein
MSTRLSGLGRDMEIAALCYTVAVARHDGSLGDLFDRIAVEAARARRSPPRRREPG